MPVANDRVSLDTAQSWAKRIHRSLGKQGHPLPLSACQTALAQAMGCSQWPALVAHLKQAPPPSIPVSPSPLPTPPNVIMALLREAGNPQIASFTDITLEALLNRLGTACSEVYESVLYFEKRRPDQMIRARFLNTPLTLCDLESDIFYQALKTWVWEGSDPQKPATRMTQRYRITATVLPAYPHGEDLHVQFYPRLTKGHSVDLSSLGYHHDQREILISGLCRPGLTLIAGKEHSGKLTVLHHLVAQRNLRYPAGPEVEVFNQLKDEGEPQIASPADITRLFSEHDVEERPVVATIFATSAFGIVQHLMDLAEPSQHLRLISSIQTLTYQFLVPFLCPKCSLAEFPISAENFSQEMVESLRKLQGPHVRYQGSGCADCQAGVTSRSACAEVVEFTDAMRRSFLKDPAAAMRNEPMLWAERGGISCQQRLHEWVAQGKVDPLEVLLHKAG